MGLADAFSAEDRVDVKFSDFYNLVEGCTQLKMVMNAVTTKVPYEYIIATMTGKIPQEQEKIKNENH